MQINIEPAGPEINVTGEIDEKERESIQLALTVTSPHALEFLRRVRQAQRDARHREQRLKKKLLRQYGRSPRPRKPAPHGRAALVAKQKKARP